MTERKRKGFFASLCSCLWWHKGKKQENVEADYPVAQPVSPFADVEQAKVVNDEEKKITLDENVDPDEFYKQFDFKFLPGESEQDKMLMARDESPDDRILDLLLILDCTSSMTSWLHLARQTLKDCVDDLKKEHSELEVRVAFVGYRDIGDKDNIFVIQDFTFDLGKVKDLISSTEARGGQDIPEDLQGALYQGLKLSWRKVSVKIAYVCTDAPCHGKMYHSLRDHYKEGSPAGLYLEDLMTDYSNRDIDFTAYDLTAQTKNMFNIMEQAYNQGGNKGQLKRITLEKEIKQAEQQKQVLHEMTGIVATNYATNFRNDLRTRASFQYKKHGWKTSKVKAAKPKSKAVFTDFIENQNLKSL